MKIVDDRGQNFLLIGRGSWGEVVLVVDLGTNSQNSKEIPEEHSSDPNGGLFLLLEAHTPNAHSQPCAG